MTYPEAMRDYYSGQHYVAIAGALAAAFYLLIARFAYARKTNPHRSFAITVFLVAGLLMLPANVAYFFSIGPQTARIESTLTRSQSEFSASENAHLNRMMAGFRRDYTTDGSIALLGLLIATAGLAGRSKKAIGIGLALSLCATTLFAGEVWSKQRALHYRNNLLAASEPAAANP